MVDDLRAQEQEWTPDDSIDTATLEQLTELRRQIVERVRNGGDIEGVRAALLTLFDGFTLRDGQIELTPRYWTLDPDVKMHSETIVMPDGREVTGVWPVDEDADVHAEPVVRNSQRNDSPSQ
jgi:hypothetical protein